MAIGLGLTTGLGLTQTLTPQQVQYLKILQLNSVQLEQFLHQELAENPMLETSEEAEEIIKDDDAQNDENTPDLDDGVSPKDDTKNDPEDDDYVDSSRTEQEDWSDYIEDDGHDYMARRDEYDYDPYPAKSVNSFIEDLIQQLWTLNLREEEHILGEEILWNIESSGYLQRNLAEITDEANERIRDENFRRLEEAQTERLEAVYDEEFLSAGLPVEDDDEDYSDVPQIPLVTPERAEFVLKKIQTLEPPGIGARTLQECLLVQLSALPRRNAAQKLAVLVLTRTYDAFRMKHYAVILRELKVSEEYLREALEAIQALNPKPGGGELSLGISSIIPDFFVHYDEGKDDIFIQLNDSRIPVVGINKEYELLRKEARRRKFNNETRDWLKQKLESAKFMMQALNQRKETMKMVATAIVGRQHDFFRFGGNSMKPLIYKDVAEDTGLDISTICRVVNGKYMQTDYGIFELRYFFSESLENAAGEEISTRVIKNKLKELIDAESPKKPLSDEQLTHEMKRFGYNIARRTIAKYRELMEIPVARMRRKL